MSKVWNLSEDAAVDRRVNAGVSRSARMKVQRCGSKVGAAATRTTLRLRVTKTAESLVRGGHPWVFANSILAQNRPGTLGELTALYGRNDRFLALGLFEPDSPIRVRILLIGKAQPLDDAWWQSRLEGAFTKRIGLFGPDTTGFRWLNGESDGWPGLV